VDPLSQLTVALKVLNPELGAVLGVERFLSEIQVTANLQYPNVLPLFDHRRRRPHCQLGGERVGLRTPTRHNPPRSQAREHPDASRATVASSRCNQPSLDQQLVVVRNLGTELRARLRGTPR